MLSSNTAKTQPQTTLFTKQNNQYSELRHSWDKRKMSGRNQLGESETKIYPDITNFTACELVALSFINIHFSSVSQFQDPCKTTH